MRSLTIRMSGSAALLSGLLAATNPAAAAAPPPSSWIPFFTYANQWEGKPHGELFGVVQPQFTHTEGAAVENNFHFNKARLGVRGTVTEDISYFTLLEAAGNGITVPTNGGVRLLDAQLNWRVSDHANIRMGQFIPNFAITMVPGALVNWIEYTDIEKTVAFFNRQGDTETTALRDTGISVWNQFPLSNGSITYELGAYNGNGLNQTSNDNNRDLIGSVDFTAGSIWGKAGYWTGERTAGTETLGKDKYSLALGWGNYVSGKYWIMAQYLKTNEERPLGAELEADGYFLAGGWKPSKNTLMVYRYADCDCADNVGPPGPRDSSVHTAAFTYYIKGQTKIIAQYDLRSDDVGPDSDTFMVYFSLPISHRL